MLINFNQISELMFIIYVLGQSVVVGNTVVDEFNFPIFISTTFDA
ncbi:MAG: hypothetical protein Q4Q18_08785 [Methanobrevibacter sp.]|nr:hypothetical protein [Methanobrevibacter sp.]